MNEFQKGQFEFSQNVFLNKISNDQMIPAIYGHPKTSIDSHRINDK